ncbi:MAG TPA: SAM-dependent methyltransferase [Micromonosporaceae bacterium]
MDEASAARIYDFYLGGKHNFPADREAAQRIMAQLPTMPIIARENRAFLGRAVSYLTNVGIRQFLDVGSGIPTEGNVHEIAQAIAPESRVAYVDIDPVAVSEGLDLLRGNDTAIAVQGDLRRPDEILNNAAIGELLDFDRPIGLLLCAVLHFVPDDEVAYRVVGHLVDALPTGSYLVISAAAAESFAKTSDTTQAAIDVYRQRATTSAASRTRDEVARFFAGLELIEPGVTWLHQWPDPTVVHADFADDPARSGEWAAVARK